ncbi:MAG: TldD protein [Chloroflexota bacterium]|nr:TldD protein [Chloroflexota bacterium]
MWRPKNGRGRAARERQKERKEIAIRELALRAIDGARSAGAAYADARWVETRRQELSVKQGRVDGLEEDSTAGLGVRVLVDGAWGFAASSDLSGESAERAARAAVEIARASARVHRVPVDLGPAAASRGRYRGQCEVDPFEVSIEDKLELLLQAEGALQREADIRVSTASTECTHWKKVFVSTEGADIEQEAWETGAGIECVAVRDAEMEKRSFPNSFGRQVAQGGWEVVRDMGLVESAPGLADEACALLRADQCPSGITTIILDASQVALQVHESCGHPTELDRVYGMEAAYAGTSFMTPDLLGRLRYGSDLVTIVADATVPGALGTFGWDDEGVPAQRVKLVDRGLFTGYLTSRETATQLAPGTASMGSMRADGWGRIPLIRMTNINLEPGTSSLDEMIGTTDDGIFLTTNRSWSIDDRRLNFQFGTELAYEVKGGKLGRMLRNANYAGITPEFWNSCDAIGDADEWRMWGLINCGKGQPGQTMRVGHGASPARFRNVQVGIR